MYTKVFKNLDKPRLITTLMMLTWLIAFLFVGTNVQAGWYENNQLWLACDRAKRQYGDSEILTRKQLYDAVYDWAEEELEERNAQVDVRLQKLNQGYTHGLASQDEYPNTNLPLDDEWVVGEEYIIRSRNWYYHWGWNIATAQNRDNPCEIVPVEDPEEPIEYPQPQPPENPEEPVCQESCQITVRFNEAEVDGSIVKVPTHGEIVTCDQEVEAVEFYPFSAPNTPYTFPIEVVPNGLRVEVISNAHYSTSQIGQEVEASISTKTPTETVLQCKVSGVLRSL